MNVEKEFQIYDKKTFSSTGPIFIATFCTFTSGMNALNSWEFTACNYFADLLARGFELCSYIFE